MTDAVDARRAGRIIGVLIVLQLVPAPVANFALLAPVLRAPGGYLANAAAYPLQVTTAALLGFFVGAVSAGIGITAWPLFRRLNQTMALWFLTLSVLGFVLLTMENVGVLTMLSVSKQAAAAPSVDVQALARTVGSAKSWLHYTNLMCAGATICVLYAVLFRFRLVPRALAAFGMVAAVLEIVAVLPVYFGERAILQLVAPLGLSQFALVGVLLTRGFVHPRAE